MGVSVGMHHELDAAFDSLLVALTNLVKDRMENAIDVIFTNCNYCVNHLLLSNRVIEIEHWHFRLINSASSSKYWFFANTNYNCVYYSLHETRMWVYLWYMMTLGYICFLGHLSVSLLIHLFLLSRDTLSLCFFLLSDACFVLCETLASALSTPALSLPWTEVIVPCMAFLAGYYDDSNSRRCKNFDISTMFPSLAADCVNDLDTVMAESVQ